MRGSFIFGIWGFGKRPPQRENLHFNLEIWNMITFNFSLASTEIMTTSEIQLLSGVSSLGGSCVEVFRLYQSIQAARRRRHEASARRHFAGYISQNCLYFTQWVNGNELAWKPAAGACQWPRGGRPRSGRERGKIQTGAPNRTRMLPWKENNSK